ETSILTLCNKATTPFGNVAAVCVYPQFVETAVNALKKTPIKIATVVNFPGGDFALQDVVQQTKLALSQGANEIDMVFPYQVYIHGEKHQAIDFVKNVKAACKNKAALKVIIESGELGSPDLIKSITQDAIITFK